MHDLSKYSPIEFLTSIKYYTGTTSPIIEEKNKTGGYSLAWLHHKGHNPHHYEYWMDNFDKSKQYNLTPQCHCMPFEDFAELVCDYLGAARAYGKNFSYAHELDWWRDRRTRISMHPANGLMLDIIFHDLAEAEAIGEVKELFARDYLEAVYNANCPIYLRTKNYKGIPPYIPYGD